jgi:hypothetical protein
VSKTGRFSGAGGLAVGNTEALVIASRFGKILMANDHADQSRFKGRMNCLGGLYRIGPKIGINFWKARCVDQSVEAPFACSEDATLQKIWHDPARNARSAAGWAYGKYITPIDQRVSRHARGRQAAGSSAGQALAKQSQASRYLYWSPAM